MKFKTAYFEVQNSLFRFSKRFYFFKMMSRTDDKIITIPMARRRVKASPKTKVLMTTAVTGSKAPSIDEVVLPMERMEMFMQ